MSFLRWILMGLLLTPTGCALFEKNLEQPKVNLQKVDIAESTLSEATLVFNFLVENPNGIDITVDQVDYAINLNGKPFTNGVVDKGFKVDAKGSALVPLPIRVKFADLFNSVEDLFNKGSTAYQVEGKVKMGLLSIPFKNIGEVKLSDIK